MARYRGPRVKIVKRLGNLPGLTRKTPKRRPMRPRLSQYGIRLCEKQKLRFHYGLSENQLVRYVKKAKQASGSTSRSLMKSLELRLDNIIFRLGFAPTVIAARQLVTHGHILVNGKSINIPSYGCCIGDSVEVKPVKKSQTLVENLTQITAQRTKRTALPPHLNVRPDGLSGKIQSDPRMDWSGLQINELLVVEYYS
uniref:Small ribosomal subunit protein uS4c n=1 Tax=Chloropicon maureeniae TaxID=1461542 RepID=A0A4D6C5R7_9CHLO|nr:ribosomal protein S4 [Chloropicon maureeniae]QBX98223.1 ribosomal protein S4 [Chloropicon maureeniae]